MKKLILLFLLLLTACGTAAPAADRATVAAVLTKSAPYDPSTGQAGTPSAPVTAVVPTAAPATADAPLLPVIYPDDPVRELTILYTNDEHGWMEGVRENLGAASLVGTWRNQFGYEPGLDSYLLLSGGDMWTGPAISTWFEGESMAEVMNAMGYTAAAVGNHDFDFGLEALRARATEANFPFLSANTRRKSDGQVATEWGIQPFTLVESNGVRVGIIGLTTTRTRTTTNPANITQLEFGDYETAVREFVPQLLEQGAELILVIGHLCEFEVRDLAARIADLPVALIGGGHCNELFATEQDGIILLEGGSHMATFAGANLTIDTSTDTVVAADYGTDYTDDRVVENAAVAAVVAKWQAQTSDELAVVIGYTEDGFEQRSEAQLALITETWLWGYPTADIALTNMGGFRADISPGQITFGDIVGVFPFNNVLVSVELTGEQVVNLLTRSQEQVAIGGLRQSNGRWILNKTGQPLDNQATYTVLVNDFMYAGGSGFGRLAQWDPNGYNTAIDWRQPLIDWLVAQNSSPAQPVDAAVAALGSQ